MAEHEIRAVVQPLYVAEARLHGDGDVAILSWDPDQEPVASVPLPHGSVHIRASWYGMGEAAAHTDFDVGGEDLSPERLRIDFWPLGS